MIFDRTKFNQLKSENLMIIRNVEFVILFWEQDVLDDSFSQKNHLTNEAHFHFERYVDMRNCRNWSLENPNDKSYSILQLLIRRDHFFGGYSRSLQPTKMKI